MKKHVKQFHIKLNEYQFKQVKEKLRGTFNNEVNIDVDNNVINIALLLLLNTKLTKNELKDLSASLQKHTSNPLYVASYFENQDHLATIRLDDVLVAKINAIFPNIGKSERARVAKVVELAMVDFLEKDIDYYIHNLKPPLYFVGMKNSVMAQVLSEIFEVMPIAKNKTDLIEVCFGGGMLCSRTDISAFKSFVGNDISASRITLIYVEIHKPLELIETLFSKLNHLNTLLEVETEKLINLTSLHKEELDRILNFTRLTKKAQKWLSNYMFLSDKEKKEVVSFISSSLEVNDETVTFKSNSKDTQTVIENYNSLLHEDKDTLNHFISLTHEETDNLEVLASMYVEHKAIIENFDSLQKKVKENLVESCKSKLKNKLANRLQKSISKYDEARKNYTIIKPDVTLAADLLLSSTMFDKYYSIEKLHELPFKILPMYLKYKDITLTKMDCRNYLKNGNPNKLIVSDPPYSTSENHSGVEYIDYKKFHNDVSKYLEKANYNFIYHTRSTPSSSIKKNSDYVDALNMMSAELSKYFFKKGYYFDLVPLILDGYTRIEIEVIISNMKYNDTQFQWENYPTLLEKTKEAIHNKGFNPLTGKQY